MAGKQIVTFTLFRFVGWRNRWWAFRQMGFSPWLLHQIPGLQWGKMLGSGAGNGFSMLPNFGVYAFLGVWEDAAFAQQFFSQHTFLTKTIQHAAEYWTVFLRAFQSHGQWDGHKLFESHDYSIENEPIAVLTRATIRSSKLLQFWRQVPRVSASVENFPGKIFAIGVGELPIVQQATFSLWKNAQQMQAYAYQNFYHKDVIKNARELGWFKEELFARFVPFATEGSWNGVNLLENI